MKTPSKSGKYIDLDAAKACQELYDSMLLMSDQKVDLEALGITDVINESKEAEATLRSYLIDIGKWTLKDPLQSKRKQVDEDISRFVKAFSVLKEYYLCLQNCEKEVKESNNKSKRRSEYKISIIAKEFEEHNCFHEFAMLVARMQFQRAKDSVIVYPDAEKFTLCLPGDSLRCPLLIPDLNTKFCNELSRVWQLNFPKLFERASGLKTALEQRTTAHVSAGITEETNGGGMLSLEDAPQPITDCSVWAQLIVQKNYELAFNKAAYPLPGMACIVQPLCNYQHIMVVPLELVLNETYGVDALIANLVANSKKKREDQTFSLAAFPIFGVRRGVCVYVPFGYVPLIVSTDSELEPNGSSYIPDYGVHILWYIGHWNEETDESVRFETLNSLRKSATQTKSLSKYSKELLAFHATHDMPPVEEETAPKEI